jgi:hypothetical protein
MPFWHKKDYAMLIAVQNSFSPTSDISPFRTKPQTNPLIQSFPKCGTRTNSGSRKDFKGYAAKKIIKNCFRILSKVR